MIVAFRDYQDCELILLSASVLRGTSFGVRRNIPKRKLKPGKPSDPK